MMKPSNPIVNTPLEAVEMRRYLAAIFTEHRGELERTTLARERKVRGEDVHQEDTVSIVRQAGSMLSRSEIVLWEESLFNAAISGYKAFMGSVFRKELLMPDGLNAVRPQLWFSRGTLWMADIPDTFTMARLLVPSFTPYGNKTFLMIANICSTPDGFPFALETEMVWAEEPISDEAAAIITAACEFINTPIAARFIEPLPRQYRRGLERSGFEAPLVYTIRLRHEIGTNRNSATEHRDYSCQWLVGAHWRNQYYPSEGRHKPVYILPYVKGDPTKPFKAPGEKVYAVVR